MCGTSSGTGGSRGCGSGLALGYVRCGVTLKMRFIMKIHNYNVSCFFKSVKNSLSATVNTSQLTSHALAVYTNTAPTNNGLPTPKHGVPIKKWHPGSKCCPKWCLGRFGAKTRKMASRSHHCYENRQWLLSGFGFNKLAYQCIFETNFLMLIQ